jgi:hypothetical protein
MLKRFARLRVLLLITAALLVHLAGSAGQVSASACIPNGGVDDTLYQTDCCSGQAVPGSTWCYNPADYGTTWASCYQICAGPTEPDCSQYDTRACIYSWDYDRQCCAAPPTEWGFCPDACYN